MISNSKKSNTWQSILTRSSLDVGMLCKSSSHDLCIALLLKSQSSQIKLSLSLKLWLSQYDWQKIGERENFSKGLVGILFLLLKLEKSISISLSLLKSRESVFKFLFLFSKLENSISNFSVSSRKW